MSEIKHTSEKIRYTGRIDIKSDGAYFYFAASEAAVKFRGSEISAVIKNNRVWGMNFLGYVIDGRNGKIPLDPADDGKEKEYQLANSLEPDKEHTLIIYKAQAASHSFSLCSVSAEEFLAAPDKPALRLEFYGDSVTAGEVTEAHDFVGRSDPASHNSLYDNSYLSYAWQTARLLDAELHCVAQGGIAVLDGTGYFHLPEAIGMESVYDKLCYFPEGGELTEWDFSRYIPHAAVFALGQNDHHNSAENTNDIDITDPLFREKWKKKYKEIVRDVFSHYGKNTRYIFIMTLLMHGREWDDAIEEMTSELKAEGIPAYHMLFKRNGAATSGHPRYAEHKEMAEELSEYIKGLIS